ncbi:DUF4268 domain-containing protein [Gelidibacter sp. F63206]|uniref:DUF4268 domain-containing protein n=1 Tax=Gelidibacter sp. F63206 TaxID=2926425 RepID=UPI001FF3F933|nr:DUF4268 domain-containing protein [Gelidibacter sp. F63206]
MKIREREHLQEWIAKNPEILGEELLIIQKEFDGFNETSERLDLLALDKAGGVVVIENKLDDTGRNVIWQALKYVSYCSTLTTKQIIKIYQVYLDSQGFIEDAQENILEFLDVEEETLLLNRNDQRIIFVANNYRKEVTSTALWLLQHNILLQCFRAIPYRMGEEMFLQMEQIIPLPETKEYMINAMEKEMEEKSKSKTVAESEATLVQFWTKLKVSLTKNGVDLLDNVSAKPYYNIGSSRGRGTFAFCIGRKGYRVELYFPQDSEKELIDAMHQYKDEIDTKFTLGSIEWERLEGKKASRIKFERKAGEITGNENSWADKEYDMFIDWYTHAMKEFYDVLMPILAKVNNQF